MKYFIFATVLLFPSVSSAATLTQSQVNALLGILQAFGVGTTTIDAVEAALAPSAPGTTIASTTATTVATTTVFANPVPVVPATNTVIAPSFGSTCGTSCVTYRPVAPALAPGYWIDNSPASDTNGTYRPASSVTFFRACKIYKNGMNIVNGKWARTSGSYSYSYSATGLTPTELAATATSTGMSPFCMAGFKNASAAAGAGFYYEWITNDRVIYTDLWNHIALPVVAPPL